MITREMQIEFERSIASIDPTLKLASKLDTNTIFYFLNVAQERYIKELFASSDLKTEESNQIRLDNIRNLITRVKALATVDEPVLPIGNVYIVYPDVNELPTGTTLNTNGGIVVALPTDYMFYVKSDSKLSATYTSATAKKWVQNIKMDSIDINALLVNNFNRPIFRNPFIVLESTNYIIYKDYYTDIYNIELTYIRKPKTLVLTVVNSSIETAECELANQTHRDIISLATAIFIEEHRYKLVKKNNKEDK